MKDRFQYPFFIAVAAYLLVVIFLRPSFSFPLNDDWVYSKDVLMTLQNGRFTFTGYESAYALFQVYLGVLVAKMFGFSFFDLRLLGIVFFLLSVFVVYLAMCKTTVSGSLKTVILLAYIFFFPNFVLSLSFMTDFFFMVLFFVSIFSYEKYLERGDLLSLACGFVFFVFAALERQLAISIPIALMMIIFFSLIRRKKMKNAALLAAVSVVSVVIVVMIVRWWNGVVPINKIPFFVIPPNILLDLHSVIFYLGLFVIPLVPLFDVKFSEIFKDKLTRYIIIAIAVLVPVRYIIGSYVRVLGKTMPYFANQMSVYGAFEVKEVMLGVRDQLFPLYGIFLTIVSLVGAVYATYIIVRMFRDYLENLLGRGESYVHKFGMVAVIATVICTAFLVLRGKMFDRYIIAVIVVFAVLMPNYIKFNLSRIRIKLSLVLLLVTSFFYYDLVREYFNWNILKWNMANEAVETYQIEKTDISAGYEWNGLYLDEPQLNKNLGEYKYVISFSALPGLDVVEKRNYEGFCRFRECSLYLLKNSPVE